MCIRDRLTLASCVATYSLATFADLVADLVVDLVADLVVDLVADLVVDLITDLIANCSLLIR